MRLAHLLLGLFVLAPPTALWSQIYVDLTTGARTGGSVGVPGGSVAAVKDPFPLALEVTIQDLYPVVATTKDQITAQLLIRNSGTRPIEIPVGLELSEIIRPLNENQCGLTIMLQIAFQDNRKNYGISLGGAAGSSSVPGSLVTLNSGESMILRVRGALGQLWQTMEHDHDPVTAEVKVVLHKTLFESDRYVEKKTLCGCCFNQFSKDELKSPGLANHGLSANKVLGPLAQGLRWAVRWYGCF